MFGPASLPGILPFLPRSLRSQALGFSMPRKTFKPLTLHCQVSVHLAVSKKDRKKEEPGKRSTSQLLVPP